MEVSPGICPELVFGCGSLRSLFGKALGVDSIAQSSPHAASTVAMLWSSDSSGASEHVHTHPRKLPHITMGSTSAKALTIEDPVSNIRRGLYTTRPREEDAISIEDSLPLTHLSRRLSSANYRARKQSKDSDSHRTCDWRGCGRPHLLHRRKTLFRKPGRCSHSVQ